MLVATRSELEEGSICFNGCSGHGTCRDFMCTCEPGYHGDDCGHFTVTGKNGPKARKKLPLVLVGFSSRSCHKCIAAETAYAAAAAELRRLKVPLLRADGDEPALRERLGELGLSTLPQVVAYRRGDAPRPYQGVHSEDGLVAFARKLKGPPVAALETLEDVVAFLGLADDAAAAARDAYAAEEGAAPNDEAADLGFRPATSAFVLGVFSDADGVEEDEYADFADVAAAQQHRHDVYFGAVTQVAISRALVDAKLVDRAPGVVLAKGRDALSSAVLDAMDEPLGGWVDARSLPAVGRLTALNFARYEKLLRPMLLLFLDLSGGGDVPSDDERVAALSRPTHDLLPAFPRDAAAVVADAFVFRRAARDAHDALTAGDAAAQFPFNARVVAAVAALREALEAAVDGVDDQGAVRFDRGALRDVAAAAARCRDRFRPAPPRPRRALSLIHI